MERGGTREWRSRSCRGRPARMANRRFPSRRLRLCRSLRWLRVSMVRIFEQCLAFHTAGAALGAPWYTVPASTTIAPDTIPPDCPFAKRARPLQNLASMQQKEHFTRQGTFGRHFVNQIREEHTSSARYHTVSALECTQENRETFFPPFLFNGIHPILLDRGRCSGTSTRAVAFTLKACLEAPAQTPTCSYVFNMPMSKNSPFSVACASQVF